MEAEKVCLELLPMEAQRRDFMRNVQDFILVKTNFHNMQWDLSL